VSIDSIPPKQNQKDLKLLPSKVLVVDKSLQHIHVWSNEEVPKRGLLGETSTTHHLVVGTIGYIH